MVKNKIIPYMIIHGDYGCMSYVPLNPTGRWKYVTNEYFKDEIFVEHKGLFFKRWVAEDDIEFYNERIEEIMECKKEDK